MREAEKGRGGEEGKAAAETEPWAERRCVILAAGHLTEGGYEGAAGLRTAGLALEVYAKHFEPRRIEPKSLAFAGENEDFDVDDFMNIMGKKKMKHTNNSSEPRQTANEL